MTGFGKTTEEHIQFLRVCQVQSLEVENRGNGRAVALESRERETLVLSQVDEEVHYNRYSGAEWSNAPSTTPTTEREPLRLVQACSGLPDVCGQ